VVGTLRYVAPERFTGPGDARSDLYALGLTLYEMATLRVAFDESDRHRLLRRVLHEEPPAPRAIDPHIPRDLETIIVKAIAKGPHRRYASAGELAEDLARFLDDRPIFARQANWREQTRRWCRRNPLLAAMSSLVLLLTLTTAVVMSLSAWRLAREAERARRAEHDAVERLSSARLAQARASRLSGRMGQRFASLEALAEATRAARQIGLDPDREVAPRSEAMAALALPDLRIVRRWPGWPPGTNGIAFDSQYERYVRHARDGTMSLRRVEGDLELARFVGVPPSGLDRKVILDFSNRGRYLLVHHPDRLVDRSFQIWELAGTPVVRLRLGDVMVAGGFDAGGELVWVALSDGTIRRYDLPDGRETARMTAGFVPRRLSLRPDGKMLAAAGPDDLRILLFDATGGPVRHTLGLKAPVESIAWGHNGRTLAVGCEDHRIHLWRADTWESPGVLEGHQWAAYELSFNRAGDRLVSIGFDRQLRLWDLSTLKTLLHLSNPKTVRFSPDDSRIGVTVKGSEVGLCEFHDCRECRSLRGHAAMAYEAAFTRDGRMMVAVAGDGIRAWGTESGRELARFPDAPGSSLLVEPADSGFLSCVGNELRRWPIEPAPRGDPAPYRIGPARRLGRLETPRPIDWMCWRGRPGGCVALMNRAWTGLLELDSPGRPTQTWETPDAGFVAASPDGRWVATGTFEGRGVRVWDTQSRTLAKERAIGDAEVAFSPDGRRLVYATGFSAPGGSECLSFEVGTWRPGPRFAIDRTSSPAPLTFSPGGKVLAVAHSMTDIVLLDAETFRELAYLQAREPLLVTWVSFSPDGRWLAACTGTGVMQLWDIALILDRLKGLGLDGGFMANPR
jgi:WD40 repeat protein